MTVPEAALSIRLPWAWWVAAGAKRIENRSWRTKFRGPVFIHASAWWNEAEVDETLRGFTPLAQGYGAETPSIGALKALRGHVIGRATVVDCVSESDSWWFCGPYGFVLEDAQLFAAPIRCAGALSFFQVPDWTREALRAANALEAA